VVPVVVPFKTTLAKGTGSLLVALKTRPLITPFCAKDRSDNKRKLKVKSFFMT
jgi:hypothetical protein